MSNPIIKKRTAHISLPISPEAVELLQAMDAAVWTAIIERAEICARRVVQAQHGSVAAVDFSFTARFCTEVTGQMWTSDFRQFSQASRTAKLETTDAPGDKMRFPTHLVFHFSPHFVRHKDEVRAKRELAKSCRAAGLLTASEWLTIIQRSVIAPRAQASQADIVRDLMACQPDTFMAGDADEMLRMLYGEPGGSMTKKQGRTASPSVN